jgi:hypothetical protein
MAPCRARERSTQDAGYLRCSASRIYRWVVRRKSRLSGPREPRLAPHAIALIHRVATGSGELKGFGGELLKLGVWDAATARLWWVDITGERLHCFDPQSGEDRSWRTNGQPGGVVLDAAGEPLVATPEGLAVLDRSTRTIDLCVPIDQHRTENRANDAKVDGRGTIVGWHDGLRQAAPERSALPGQRR